MHKLNFVYILVQFDYHFGDILAYLATFAAIFDFFGTFLATFWGF